MKVFFNQETINNVLALYAGGVAIEDISACVGITTEDINNILDRILPCLN